MRTAVCNINADRILVKSPVTPGTCMDRTPETGKNIVFSPEYMGESKYWTPPQFPDPVDPVGHGFVILGGFFPHCSQVADILLPLLGPCTRFRFMTHTEAEIVKYAENAFFSLKVTFANELRRICEAAMANYHTVREGWLDDPRVGPMHTAAFKDARGFSGKCLPKDTAALAAYMRQLGLDDSLLAATLKRGEI
jgi:UDP-glucose 6-dehydrogenase